MQFNKNFKMIVKYSICFFEKIRHLRSTAIRPMNFALAVSGCRKLYSLNISLPSTSTTMLEGCNVTIYNKIFIMKHFLRVSILR